MSDYTSARPGTDEYHPYFEGYISLVPHGDVLETLERQAAETRLVLAGVEEARAGAAYEAGKWTLKQVVGHVIDTERVFSYRALAIARGDSADLPGMDQDVYVGNANFDARPLSDLAAEFGHVRAATLDLLRGLDETAWLRRGVANQSETSVRAVAHLIAGHAAHHLHIIRTRYLDGDGR
jgi:hypothetical protein